MNKELTQKLTPGHATCAGCLAPAIVRTVLNATNDDIVVSAATGCLEVTTTIYPNTSWKVPFIHSAFANAAATISGVETAHKALLKKKKIKSKKGVKFVVFGGDGGTYDIGLQALSGALERGHDFLYVCYDNGAYMNTGNQRSGATPFGADTETTPAGELSLGKTITRKDIVGIVAAHHIPYVATANIAYLNDFKKKVEKAFRHEGPKFIVVLTPCVNQWKFPLSQGVNISKLATETNFWPLYEIENGKYKITYAPKSRMPIEDFYKTQGRFKHLFGKKNATEIFKAIQSDIDIEMERLKKLERCA